MILIKWNSPITGTAASAVAAAGHSGRQLALIRHADDAAAAASSS